MSALKQIFTAFLLSILIVPIANSQPANLDKQKLTESDPEQDYAILIRKINHLNAALKTVRMMEEEDDNAINRFEVVICGKGVTQLNNNADLVGKANQAGITLSACGMSLNKFSISRDELPQGVGVVANGLIRMFNLQEQGYKTITL